MVAYQRSVPNLIPGEDYILRVRSVNGNGIPSDWNDSIILDIPNAGALPPEGLSPVTGVEIVAGMRMLFIRFDPNRQNVLDGYNIYVSDTPGFTADDSTLVKEVGPVTLTGVSQYAFGGNLFDMVSLQTYYVRIRTRAVGGQLSDPTAEFSAIPGQVDDNTIESLVIDKLIAGNLEVAMTLTAGSIATAAAGARFTLDSNNFIGFRSDGTTDWFDFDRATETVTFKASDSSNASLVVGSNGIIINSGGTHYLEAQADLIRITNGTTPVFEVDATGNLSITGDVTATSGTFSGNISGATIDIGGTDATSWHVDVDGNMWWGSSTTYAGATNKISNTGDATLTSGTFSGNISGATIDIGGTDATSWHVDVDGNMWWGSSATYAGATNKISNTGSIDFTTGNFSGTLSSGISISSPVITGGQIDIGGTDTTSWHVDSSGNMWWGSAGSYAAASIKVSSSGFVNFTSGNFSGTLSSGISISSPVITGGTMTAGTFQTATSGKRVVIADSGTYADEVAFYASGSTPLATMDAQTTSFVIDTTGTLLLRGGATGTGASAGIQIYPDGGGELLMNLTLGSDLHVQSGAQTLLYVDESTERVGIRVNNPQSSLAILASGTDQSLRCSTGAEINTTGATGAHGDFIVNCSGTNFRVDAGGGGVTAPGTTVSGSFYNFNSWNVPVSGLAAPRDVYVEDGGFFGYNASSIRYKTMVEDLDPEYGRKIYDFRPVWYRRYPEPYDVQDENGVSPWSEYGLIAEEVHEIEPRLVAYDSDGSCNCKTQTVENYGGGGVTRDIVRHHPSCMNVPSTVHYKSFVPHLIWAVKDHVKRIEELESQIVSLQDIINNL